MFLKICFNETPKGNESMFVNMARAFCPIINWIYIFPRLGNTIRRRHFDLNCLIISEVENLVLIVEDDESTDDDNVQNDEITVDDDVQDDDVQDDDVQDDDVQDDDVQHDDVQDNDIQDDDVQHDDVQDDEITDDDDVQDDASTVDDDVGWWSAGAAAGE